MANVTILPPTGAASQYGAQSTNLSLRGGAERLLARAQDGTVAVVSTQPANDPLVVFLSRYQSDHSRRAMRTSLDACARILLARDDATALDVPWQTLRYGHMQALRARLAGDYSPASANRHLTAVRGVLKECWRLEKIREADYRKAIDVDPVRGQRVPKGRALTEEEIASLFATARKRGGAQGARDTVLLILAYGCGLRRSEVAALPLDAYHPEDNALLVLGKGNKERLVYLPPNAAIHMSAWLSIRGHAPGPLLTPVDRYGLVNQRRGLSEQGIYSILQELAEAAGTRAFSPHDLRRTFITSLLDADVDVLTVRHLAGHADVQTTARYDRRGEKAKQQAMRSLVAVPDFEGKTAPAPRKSGGKS